ncbi:MAG: cell division topological specificity factor MinE [Epulopiscium sp.]|nr:cell division topological specificity factor MinE [Candidatus Epulonipiscium sp.]
MINAIKNLFGNKDQSGDVAKDRLQLLLIHDRMNCSTELLEMMKADIVAVISKYVDIDDEEFDIEISTMETDETHKKSPVLSANIPIKNIKNQKKK